VNPARRLWQHYEAVHAVTYFAPEVADALAAAGLQGWWRGYFAARGGPLGPVGPEVVEATFFGFAPVLVRKVLPSAWEQATPAAAMAARDAAIDAVLERLIGSPPARVVELAELAVTGCSLPGRPLFAAHAALPRRDSLRLRLWWACTLLREHRGDGHIAALLAAGVDPCMANQLAVADGVAPADRQQAVRGWSDDEWRAAGERARQAKAGLRDAVEARTDELASGPVEALGPDGVEELCAGLAPIVDAIAGSGLVPYPNPIGVTRPASVPAPPPASDDR
jgi:hypothetical protein